MHAHAFRAATAPCRTTRPATWAPPSPERPEAVPPLLHGEVGIPVGLEPGGDLGGQVVGRDAVVVLVMAAGTSRRQPRSLETTRSSSVALRRSMKSSVLSISSKWSRTSSTVSGASVLEVALDLHRRTRGRRDRRRRSTCGPTPGSPRGRATRRSATRGRAPACRPARRRRSRGSCGCPRWARSALALML